jgi:hypothetical protein
MESSQLLLGWDNNSMKINTSPSQKSKLVYAMEMTVSSRTEFEKTRTLAAAKTYQFWTTRVRKIANQK